MHAYNNFSFVYHRCATSLLPWQVIGPFNMALDDINKMLEEARNQALISVAINAGANMLIGYWTSSYQKAVEQVGESVHCLMLMWKANSPASLILHHYFDTRTCVEATCLACTGSIHMLPVAREIQGVRD